MQQLFFIEPGKVEWREAPEPRLESDRDALVRPLAVSTCDLDRSLLKGEAPVPGPFAFGHEFVAEVVETGDAAGVQPGERALVSFQISCGECEFCRRGHTGNCAEVQPTAMYGLQPLAGEWGGAFADLVRVPYARSMLQPLPEGVAPATVASAADNVSDGWRTVAEPLRQRPGERVLIVGGGAPSVSLYTVQAAVALGAGAVDFADDDPERLALAESFGARVLEGELPKRFGQYPITVDASSAHEGLACALRSTAPEGVCTSVGIYFEEQTPVPLLEMFSKGITFKTGRVHSCSAAPEVLELVAAGKLAPERVTTRTVAWDDLAEALADPPLKLVAER